MDIPKWDNCDGNVESIHYCFTKKMNMTQRAFYQASLVEFLNESNDSIIGKLSSAHSQDLVRQQTNAWHEQVLLLKENLQPFVSSLNGVFFEFVIPRMGKRADVVLVINGLVFVIEFKVGAEDYAQHCKDQVLDYCLDLKNFHEGSHAVSIVPILVSTDALDKHNDLKMADDGLVEVVCVNKHGIRDSIQECLLKFRCGELVADWSKWAQSKYKPTPTIIQAAQALYQGHKVEDISRSDAGAKNLSETAAVINAVIERAKSKNEKAICFVTGVPGAGKTLAGLNITTSRMKAHEDEHAVFLSGNGPLVDVLREALARDEKERTGEAIGDARRKSKTFIQNIHHFRDDNLNKIDAPIEKVVVFDEAQRAWDRENTTKFMKQKRDQLSFNMSEPEFLIQVMDRHPDWCVIVALIGGGQEINTGEAGLSEWFASLRRSFMHWQVFYSDQIKSMEYIQDRPLISHLEGLSAEPNHSLHLSVSVRSFRAEKLSAFIGSVINNQVIEARSFYDDIKLNYPIVLTRNIHAARRWLKRHARGSELYGMIASSGANRLKPEGINIKAKITPAEWFLNGSADVRSCQYLEDVATEFDIQGLELDWVCVCWDADFRYIYNSEGAGEWSFNNFSGTKWHRINKVERKRYLANAYRVLLTRARQGMVIYVPEGDPSDQTRPPEYYAGIYQFLRECGLPEME